VGAFFLFLLFLLTAAGLAQQVSPQPLITLPIDESQLTTLKGNTHPLAQPQFDVGVAAPDMPLQRMLLVLKRSPQQDFALSKLLDDQQDKGSSNYHKWLAPDEFGVQFGPSDQDVQLITGWLQSHGFQVNRVAHGRTVIEFSGVESQVEGAFHTQIHAYAVNGQQHWANASDPQIPAALAPAVAGVLSLNNFPAQPMLHIAGAMSRDKSTGQVTPVNPLTTYNGNCGVQSNCYGVGPYDFATIYNVAPLWNATPAIDGTGQTIAIVGETDINPQDVADFRNYFGLPPVTLNVIHDGPAPGILRNGEETESDLDVQWSGAVAKGASIDFVVSQSTETTAGIDLSALYIIDNNLAPVMSESYGFCELGLGTAGNQGFNAMWEQAAAQGITVMISAGDNGAAGCDNFNAIGPARFGLQVSGFASTPFNVAVGGTDFYDLTNANLYWNNTNAATTQASAISYIPETTWDDSCTNPVFGALFGFSNNAETNCNDPQLIQFGFVNVVGGSGGKSNCTQSSGQNPATCAVGYPKPSWQVAPGVPADGVRDLPDVSLYAASGSPSGSFYIVCEADQVGGGSSCDPTNPNTNFLGVGGTSASAPAFAGVMALVNQKNPTPHGQGNANYVLYKLAAAQNAASCNSTNGSGSTCVFNDVTTGTIAMPCAAGSPNCQVQTPGDQYGILTGYSTGTGYDQATGLGSVNVKNLVTKWTTATFRSSAATLTLGPPTSGVTHGQSVNVNISVAPGSGSGTPTGDVSLLTSTGVSVDGFTLSNGTVSGTTTLLPGGTYTVTAHYAGDTVFGGSDSSPVSVTVGKENSSAHIELVTFDWNGNLLSNNATTAVYGTPNLLRVDVFGSSGTPCSPSPLGGAACPTGNMSLTDNNSPLDAGTFGLNSLGYTEDQTVQLPGGSDSVKAQYAGDSSFNASTGTATYQITPAPTTLTDLNTCCFAVGDSLNSTSMVQAQSLGAGPTGTLMVFVNGNMIPGASTISTTGSSGPTVSSIASFQGSSSPFTDPGSYTIKLAYSGDTNYQASSIVTTQHVFCPTPTLTLQPSQGSVNPGSSVALIVTVVGCSKTIAPTGTILFYEAIGGLTALPGAVSYATVTDPNTGNLALQGTLTVRANFTVGYNAAYNGDANYPSAGNCCVTVVTVNGNDFTLSAQQSSVSVSPGSLVGDQLVVGLQSGTSPVSFGSNPCSGLPPESSCSVSPDPTSNTGLVTLAITTTGSNRALGSKPSARNSRYPWLGSTLPFVAILLLAGYRRRGSRRLLSRISLTFMLVLGMGCGGGGSSGGGGGGGGGTPPPVPTSLAATAISSSKINLGWFPSAGATSYNVYRSTTSGFTPSSSNQIANTNQSSFYPDSGLSPATTYYYALKAANGSGALSGASNQASATTQVFDPGTPAGTYNITVTATSGAISHSVNVTLIVQ
jgi:hypothetical protein